MEEVTALEAVVRSAEICRETFIFSITCEMLTAPGCLLLFIFKVLLLYYVKQYYSIYFNSHVYEGPFYVMGSCESFLYDCLHMYQGAPI